MCSFGMDVKNERKMRMEHRKDDIKIEHAKDDVIMEHDKDKAQKMVGTMQA